MLRRRFLSALLLVALTLAWQPAALAQRAPKKPKERADVAAFRVRADAILSDAKTDKGHWGVLIADAATGETLYAHNQEKYFTPASNTKLYTTIPALALLGPDYRWHTTLESRGLLDKFGRLSGDVVFVGRGDPNLSNRKFPYETRAERDGPPEKILAELADQLLARGVKQIEGDVIADDSYFPYERYPSGWDIDDMTYGYGAPVSALTVNDNTLVIELRPGDREGAPAWFGVEPWAEFYEFVNEVRTAAAGARAEVSADREPGAHRVVLRGTVALGAEPRRVTLAVEEPAEFAAALLKRLLEARGVRVYGHARAQHEPALAAGVAVGAGLQTAPAETSVVLAEHVSVSLLDDVRLVNKISQNLHAELLLRAIGREKGAGGSVSASLKAVQECLKSIGIAEGDVSTYDGSGLSRRNLITPRATVTLLAWAAKQPWAEQFIASLPVAAQDGTLAERMKDTPTAGRIHAKTGSLGNVSALSGFADTLHGTRVVFSMFGNAHNLRGADASAVLDALCAAIVEELGAPPAAKRKKR
ncbi:MAG TPA: D-alanyl-D-alanine carboxypeptidase/D-alanyl-D-alanine-endopeptidase [Candidatus Acidoferrales bacterium]|nr:D-alanyl-D-alanine carboxypeptidase/D-alanyl-D-alanine-endopeptidase [Candidatus Acidoferrales bacterium]